jgi:hypothetical protein
MKYTITSMPNSRLGVNAPLQACPKVDQEEMHKTINEIDECEIRFIMDSHGNGLDAKKMYRYKQTEIIILNKGEKKHQRSRKILQCKQVLLIS